MNALQIITLILVALIAGQLGLWVAERNPPTEQLEARIEGGPFRPGERMLLREKIKRGKVCGLRIEKIIFDANGVRYPISGEDYPAAPGTVGIDIFAQPIRLPIMIAQGEGFVRVVKVYYCNPLHKLNPIVAPLIQVPFVVHGEPVTEQEKDKNSDGSLNPTISR